MYILHTRGEQVNVICLLISLLNINFWIDSPRKVYFDNIIKLIRPKAIITLMDNDILYYKIGSRIKSLTKIFIQNGLRGGGSDGFMKIQKNEDNRVDYMLVFNKHIGKKYEEFIKGKSYVIGSIKNNYSYISINEKETQDENYILLISNYRKRTRRIKYTWNNIDVSHDMFYEHDELVIKCLAEWCSKNNLKLLIAGFQSIDDQNEIKKERSWFDNFIENTNFNWEYLPRKSIYSTYNLLNKAKIVVGTNTTVTYESFSRGKKTAFLTGRSDSLNEKERKFGWPHKFHDKGPFWSNNSSKSDLNIIMNFLNNVSDEEWNKLHNQYHKDLMFLDPGNKILIDLLQKIAGENQKHYKS